MAQASRKLWVTLRLPCQVSDQADRAKLDSIMAERLGAGLITAQ